MFALFRAFLLAMLLTFSTAPAPTAPPFTQDTIDRVTASEHVIGIYNALDGGRCTATAVGPHTLLTAGHCYVVSYGITVDGTDRTILAFESDNNDHLLIWVSGDSFKSWLEVTERQPMTSEQVVVVGNPGQSRSVLRFGTFDKAETDTGEDNVVRDMYWFRMFAAPGDSGSGMVDASGHVIGVVTGGITGSAETFTFPLSFSTSQLAKIN